MNRTARALTLLAALAALAVAGCGGDDDNQSASETTTPPTTESTPTPSQSSGGGKMSELKLSADPGGALKFDKDELSAKAGKVTITLDNPSTLPHAIELEGNGVEEEGETVQKGGTSTVTAELKPGKYEFYCPVPGHKDGGMEGTLTVK